MDALTLVIDAATYDGSVALFGGSTLVAERTIAMRGEHEERMMPAVAALLAESRIEPGALAHVVCGGGPGSFTSLRIAAAIAKGLVTVTGAPLFGVPSLALAAVDAGVGRWLVTLDALRGEQYTAGFAWDGRVLEELSPAEIVPQSELATRASALEASVLAARPHARAAGPLLATITSGEPVDLAAWEPSYGRRAEAQVRWEATHGRPLAP